jgi:hypothetical protein
MKERGGGMFLPSFLLQLSISVQRRGERCKEEKKPLRGLMRRREGSRILF